MKSFSRSKYLEIQAIERAPITCQTLYIVTKLTDHKKRRCTLVQIHYLIQEGLLT